MGVLRPHTTVTLGRRGRSGHRCPPLSPGGRQTGKPLIAGLAAVTRPLGEDPAVSRAERGRYRHAADTARSRAGRGRAPAVRTGPTSSSRAVAGRGSSRAVHPPAGAAALGGRGAGGGRRDHPGRGRGRGRDRRSTPRFAFVQELQAERAVEALQRYLPQRARRCCATARAAEVDARRARPRRRARDRARATGSRPTRGCSTGRSRSTSRP